MPLTNNLVTVLRRCHLKPPSLQSNYARDHMHQLAELASRGLITTHLGKNHYGNHWRISAGGLLLLELIAGETE